MKQILPKIIVFVISFLLFAVAFTQIFIGYVRIGRASGQQKIQMSENPQLFWIIVAIPIIFGALFLIWGILLLNYKGKNK
jgi:hypothetical protein